jgi:hypothetical protein
MRTAIIIAAGFVLLAICLFAGRLLGRSGAETMVLGAKIFIPLWLIIAGVNLWIGVAKAGYTVVEELPIFALIFALPAAAAAFAWWKLS